MSKTRRNQDPEYREQDRRVRELALQVRAGNNEAFGELWGVVAGYVAKVLVARLAAVRPDPDEIEDVLSQASVRLLRATRTTYDPGRNWRHFVGQVARNLAFDHIAARNRRGEVSLEGTVEEIARARKQKDRGGCPRTRIELARPPWETVPAPDAREAFAQSEQTRLVHLMLDLLRPDDAMLLRKLHMEGMTTAAVAAELGSTPARISRRAAEARDRARLLWIGICDGTRRLGGRGPATRQ